MHAVPALAQPDVIPISIPVQAPLTPQPEEVPPPAQFINDLPSDTDQPATTTQIAEGIYANIQRQSANAGLENEVSVAAFATENSESIYQNQQDLADYIEDTGIRAIALYDYEAAAEDEISFDPDDIITHIEQVCIVLHMTFDIFSYLFNRLMRAGGEDSAKTATVFSLPTTYSCKHRSTLKHIFDNKSRFV